MHHTLPGRIRPEERLKELSSFAPFRLHLTDSSAGYYQDGEPVLSLTSHDFIVKVRIRLVESGKALFQLSAFTVEGKRGKVD